jgi:hypothetical protein
VDQDLLSGFSLCLCAGSLDELSVGGGAAVRLAVAAARG